MRTTTPLMNTTRSLLAAACALTCLASQATTITITSRDAPGFGFNDPTVVAPVGGNLGTTLGQQRMNVYRFVADIWEKNIDSDVPITVSAGWEALTCTSTTATLGSASAQNLWHDFPGGVPGTWYPQALANKLAHVNLSANASPGASGYANVDIKTQFNVNLGNTGCFDGGGFYLGLDGKAGANINFVETLLHELGHGLGFSVLSVNTTTGQRINSAGTAYSNTGLPSIWEGFMYDSTAGKTWLAMTPTERKASAINPLHLSWNGSNVVAGVGMLAHPAVIAVASPGPSGTGMADFGTASFGPAAATSGTFGALAVVPEDAVNGAGCLAFTPALTGAVSGKVAIISRGTCGFAVKAKNAQNAGAIGVIIANNAAGAAPGLGGTDATVTIPTISVSQDAGVALKAAVPAAVPYGTRAKPGLVTVSFSTDPSRIAGAEGGRPLLYTPGTLVSGSSVSHWDVSATPNLLMEPNINADLGTILVAPKDLTVPLLKDIGW